jgi:hypothetical protein
MSNSEIRQDNQVIQQLLETVPELPRARHGMCTDWKIGGPYHNPEAFGTITITDKPAEPLPFRGRVKTY